MKNTNVFIMTLLSGAIFLGSCKKEDEKDTTPPTIQWVTPINATYTVGDTVFINAKVTDDVEMHEVHVHIYKKPMKEEVFYLKRHSHSKTVNIETYHVLPEGSEGDYEIEIEAIDDARNETEVEEDFRVN